MPAYDDILRLVGIISALREPWDHHGDHVAEFAVILADALELPQQEIELIRIGANLHDVGKLLLPEKIVNKPDRLDDEERAQMERHSELGWEIVNKAGYDEAVQAIVRHHHERRDGKGYPDGLKGDEIPIGAQIVGLCDEYDALTSDRAYRKAFAHQFAQARIQQHKTTHYHPNLVDLFFDKVKFRL